MKFQFSFSLLLAALVCSGTLLNNPLHAQQSAGRICLLDVAKVFKDNPSFQAQMEGIRKEASTLKANVETQLNQLQEEAKQLEEYQANSEKRRELERSLVSKQADLQTRARQAEADLLTREAKIYLQTYKQMEQIVAQIAEANDIALVLRYESAPINSEDRADVIKGVNRQVVFLQKHNDMTDAVQKYMNATAQAPSGTQNR